MPGDRLQVRSAVRLSIAVLANSSRETLKGIQEKLNCGETPDFGSEVLIAAWMQWQHMDKDSFSAWESSVVRELAQAVMPEIR